jgi:hypothetical protein
VACAAELGSRARAAICIFAHGDEYVFSYFACGACGRYTVEVFHDAFMGESGAHVMPQALEREEGERAVGLVGACPAPRDKLCDCASHRALQTGRPARAG